MASSSDRKLIVNGALAAGVALVLVLVGVLLDWPVAIVVLTVAALVAVVGSTVWRIVTAPRGPAHHWGPVRPPGRSDPIAPEPDTEPIGPLPVGSATAEYTFAFTARAHWRLHPGVTPRERDLQRAQACSLIVDRAAEIAHRFAPGDGVHAGLRIARVLGRPQVGPDGGMDVWATDVSVALADEDRARLHRLDEIGKNVDLARRERDFERELREYLGDDVLRSTGSTLVWWLARHIDEIDGAVAHIPALARLSATAQNRAGTPGNDAAIILPTTTWTIDEDPATLDDRADPSTNGMADVRAVVERLAPKDDFARHQTARYMAGLAERCGSTEFAEEIRREFADPEAHAEPEAGASTSSDTTSDGSTSDGSATGDATPDGTGTPPRTEVPTDRTPTPETLSASDGGPDVGGDAPDDETDGTGGPDRPTDPLRPPGP